MTQASLFDASMSRPRKRGRVPRTSVAAYLARARPGRVHSVVVYLTAYPEPATSAEMAYGMFRRTGTDELLYVRRGLSDALSQGLVEHAGERTCAVSGRKCVAWRTVAR